MSAYCYTISVLLDDRQVYERLIVDLSDNDKGHIIDQLVEVYPPWIDAAISNYNTDFYYPPRGYLWVCYEEGQICA